MPARRDRGQEFRGLGASGGSHSHGRGATYLDGLPELQRFPWPERFWSRGSLCGAPTRT